MNYTCWNILAYATLAMNFTLCHLYLQPSGECQLRGVDPYGYEHLYVFAVRDKEDHDDDEGHGKHQDR